MWRRGDITSWLSLVPVDIPNMFPKCPECPKICKTKYHLDDHIKGTHTRIPCEHCGLMIPIRRKERHIEQAHVNPEDQKYKCDHCGKGFTDRQKLNDHINTHTGERPYIC